MLSSADIILGTDENTYSQGDVSGDVAKRAVEWLLDWQEADEPTHIWESICQWRKESNEHELAWQQIERINKKFKSISSPVQSKIAHATLTSPRLSRRNTIKALSLLIVVGSSGWLASRQKPWQNWMADYYTVVGQQQSIELADGTVLTLNSDTAIDVRYTNTERRLVLTKGEIYIRSGTNGQNTGLVAEDRPLIIESPYGELQPLGTRFTVRQLEYETRLAVYEGRVQIQPINNPESTILDAGQELTFTKTDWSTTTTVEETDVAWTQGIIVANNMRLQDFLTELDRHRTGLIQCAPEIGNLRVSGTYPLNQADEVLEVLTQVLPIKVQSYTRYLVRVLSV